MATSEKLLSTNNSKPLKKRFNYRPFNCGAYRKEQISSSKLPMVPHKKTQIFCTKMTTSEKFQLSYNSKPLKKQVLLYARHLQPNCGTYPIVQIQPLKLPMIFYKHRLVEKTFVAKMAPSEISYFTCTKIKKNIR